jgi:hypothetical protein
MPVYLPHPFDPLSSVEIEIAIGIVKKAYGEVNFHVVSLQEPRKAVMTPWLADPQNYPRPPRVADVVVIAAGGKVWEGLVDLSGPSITKWEQVHGAQPIVGLITTSPQQANANWIVRSLSKSFPLSSTDAESTPRSSSSVLLAVFPAIRWTRSTVILGPLVTMSDSAATFDFSRL